METRSIVCDSTPLGEKWELCLKIEAKERRRAKHVDDYNRWRKEPRRYQASIEKAISDIKTLENEINLLKLETWKGLERKQESTGSMSQVARPPNVNAGTETRSEEPVNKGAKKRAKMQELEDESQKQTDTMIGEECDGNNCPGALDENRTNQFHDDTRSVFRPQVHTEIEQDASPSSQSIASPSTGTASLEISENGPISGFVSALCFAQIQNDLKRLSRGIQRFKNGNDDDESDDYDNSSPGPKWSDTQLTSADGGRSRLAGANCTHEDSEGDVNGARTYNPTPQFSMGIGGSREQSHESSRKRHKLSDNSDDRPGTTVGTQEKNTRARSKQTFCLFKHGPGKHCSGTDESIAEALEKLGTMHDTYICARCWDLKAPGDDHLECTKHCISVSCPGSDRHPFNSETCGPELSRTSPKDREATYLFVFALIHPNAPLPHDIFTSERQVHWGASTRQGARQKNIQVETLAQEAASLKRRLEEAMAASERQDKEMQTKLYVSNLEHQLQAKEHAGQEERRKRIEHILRDLLRMVESIRHGSPWDEAAHGSLLQRVRDDAPDALLPMKMVDPAVYAEALDPQAMDFEAFLNEGML